MTPEFNTKNNVYSQVVNTVARTVKVKVPDAFRIHLERLYQPSLECARRMLKNRENNSTKFYPEIPSVIAKAILSKYQRNPKCKNITNLVLPICGDKGKQIKSVLGGVRITALFKKEVFPVIFPLPVQGFIRSVEFFKRDGQWFATFCYNTPTESSNKSIYQNVVGVDRNSVGNIAMLADPRTGKVLKLGFSPAPTKRCMRGRRANLQKAGAFSLLRKIKRKQRRRMTYENHAASRTIVNYAVKHRCAIAIEDLKDVRASGSKIRKYAESNNWACAQLETFIAYKAALPGVPIIRVNPAFTSQMCSRCGSIHKPSGKRFVCGNCSHTAHRDVNSSFNIAQRGMEVWLRSGGSSSDLNMSELRPIGSPRTGKAVGSYA